MSAHSCGKWCDVSEEMHRFLKDHEIFPYSWLEVIDALEEFREPIDRLLGIAWEHYGQELPNG